MADDYNKVLGVQRTALLEDIQDASREASVRWSRRANTAPKAADRSNAEQRVELLAEIKSVLTDPARKSQYDATPGGGQRSPWPQPPPGRGQDRWDLEASNRAGLWGLWSNRRNCGHDVGDVRRIRNPVLTAFLVIFAFASFGSAGLHGFNGNSSDG
jgi:hypothetical protein